jgi:hypothetical protein
VAFHDLFADGKAAQVCQGTVRKHDDLVLRDQDPALCVLHQDGTVCLPEVEIADPVVGRRGTLARPVLKTVFHAVENMVIDSRSGPTRVDHAAPAAGLARTQELRTSGWGKISDGTRGKDSGPRNAVSFGCQIVPKDGL